jgi:hypothetical protein
MITPPTNCFYVVRAEGEAAGFVCAALSARVKADIATAVLVSEDFSNDLQATNGFDSTVKIMKAGLVDEDLVESVELNPLYIPSSQEDIDDMLDGDASEDNFHFTGMDGNPFTLKLVSIMSDDKEVIQGKVSCKPFDLPSYTDIVAAQHAIKLQ